MVALVSQLVAPTTVAAAQPPATVVATAANTAVTPAPKPAGRFELDPDDTNPTLFAMAPDQTDSNAVAQAGALGGELSAPKERQTPSGLRITDLVIGSGTEAVAG